MSKKKSKPLSKRKILARIIVVIACLCSVLIIGIVTFLTIRYNSQLLNTVGSVSFEKALPIPELAPSVINAKGIREFNIAMQTGETEFFEGTKTDTWGVNSSYLGPTLRAKRGEKVQVNVTNKLPEESSMHWHGMHLPARMDGGPHQPIKSTETWSPQWEINQPAATLWYHPHPHGQTEKHVDKGVSGMFILDDNSQTANALPREYGKDDIPVIIQDKKFTKDMQFDDDDGGSTGMIGDEVLVNGVRTPHLDIHTSKVRLRLLNGSTARIYNFGLSSGADMQIIASDSGLLERPTLKKQLMLSPGERAEVIITLKPNERTHLRSYPTDVRSNWLNNRAFGNDDTLEIMELRAGKMLTESSPVPNELARIEKLKENEAAQTRTFILSGEREINGRQMDMNRIDVTAQLDTTEIWQIENAGNMPHNFHIHDVQFQILTVDGALPPAELQGLKDTVVLLPNQTVRLITRFSDYSDAETPYMFHCHLLRHEDKGMMGQFVVLKPGEVARPRLPTQDHGMNH